MNHDMTPTQFRRALDALGLTQVRAAQLLSADGRTVRRWAAGERAIPATVAMLLRLLVTGKLSIDDLEAAQKRS